MTVMCRRCEANRQVLPSIEHFQDRLKNPKMYYFFYHYFVRAVIGESQWKRNIQGKLRLATSPAEAYAHSLIENNYFAWMFEYKYEHSGATTLKTAYDDEDIGNLFGTTELKEVEVALPEEEGGGFKCIEKDKDEQGYEAAKRKREETEEETAKQATSETDGHKKIFDKMNDTINNLEATPPPRDQREAKRKKRRLMKDLKVHTGAATSSRDEGRRRQSVSAGDKTNRFLNEMTKMIKIDVRAGKQKQFETMYMQLEKILEGKKEEARGSGKEDRYTIDCDSFYEEAEEVYV